MGKAGERNWNIDMSKQVYAGYGIGSWNRALNLIATADKTKENKE